MNNAHKEVCKLMGEHYVELVFDDISVLPFSRGCYINYNDSVYTLKKDAAPEPLLSSNGYRYSLKFYARQHLMEHRVFRWLTGPNKEVTFNLTTTLEGYAKLLVDNMNAYMGDSYAIKWNYNAIPEELSKTTKALSFTGISCWQAMEDIAKAFGVEWWVKETNVWVGTTQTPYIFINFGKCNNGEYIDIKEGGVVNRFPASKRGEDENFGTRFFVYGGTKNIPEGYYEDNTGGTTNHVSDKRLHLPNGIEYLDAVEGLSGTEIVEKPIILDDVFPRSNEIITDIEISEAKILEWEPSTEVYIIKAENTHFSGKEEDIIGTLGVTFTSGALNGRSFDVNINKAVGDEVFDGKFEIIAKVEGESGSSQIVIPNPYLKPDIGDTFVLTGIKLPEGNILDAENELLEKGLSLVAQYYSDTNVYDCPTNPIYCARNDINMILGQNVRLLGAQFGDSGRNSRVQGYEKLLYDIYIAIYNIGDNNVYSRRISEMKRLNGVTSLKLRDARSESKSDFSHLKLNPNGTQEISNRVNVLIGDDKWKSVREIAEDVAEKTIPTEVATAVQKMEVSEAPAKNAYIANVVYEFQGSPATLTIQTLTPSEGAYDNVWTIRFGCTADTMLRITPSVLWKDGAAPTFSTWGVCELIFRRQSDLLGGTYLGEWKIYK